MRPRRRNTDLARSRFRSLASHYCQADPPHHWKLTRKGYQQLQKHVEAALMRILAVAVQTLKAKTLNESDVRRAERYFSLMLGINVEEKIPILLPQRLCYRHLKVNYPNIRVTRDASKRIRNLYTGIVRFLIAAIATGGPAVPDGHATCRVGADDVDECFDGFVFTSSAAPAALISTPVADDSCLA